MDLIREVEGCKTKTEAIALIRDRMKEATGVRPDVYEAEEWLTRNLPLEKDYQKKIMARIRKLFPDAFVWKASAGQYSTGGLPDVCCVIHGRFYGFEVKRPFFGRVSGLQGRMIDKIRAAGGRAYVVTSADQVEELLAQEREEGTGMTWEEYRDRMMDIFDGSGQVRAEADDGERILALLVKGPDSGKKIAVLRFLLPDIVSLESCSAQVRVAEDLEK